MSFNADKIISSIVALRNSDASSPSWDATEAISLATHVGQLFESEPTLLEIKGPVTVIGEIHGQLDDLLAILDRLYVSIRPLLRSPLTHELASIPPPVACPPTATTSLSAT